MDIFGLFRKTFETLKSNLLLFLPVLVINYLVPVALAIAAAYIFIPIFVIVGNVGDLMMGTIAGGLLGLVIIAILALILLAAVFAGWGNMNQVALETGRVSFEDFKSGFSKYFGRVLAAIVIMIVIILALGLIGLATAFAIGVPVGKEIMEQIPKLAGSSAVEVPPIPSGLIEIIAKIFRLATNIAGVALFLVTIAGIWLLFTLFWIPAIIVSDMPLFGALSRSFSFVRRNFYSVIGYISLYIIADRFTATIFPGGGGGGGAGGPQGGYGFGFGIAPALEGVFRVLIQAFFILLLYAIYIDRQPSKD